MAEAPYVPHEYGWFKVSRRIVGCSRWRKSSPETVKLMVYLLERASQPTNPFPGDVYEVGGPLADAVKISEESLDVAIADLCGPDEVSQGRKLDGAFLEPLTRDGSVVGYRIVNFEDHNPGAIEMGSEKRRQRRVRAAKVAAAARYGNRVEPMTPPEPFTAEPGCSEPDCIGFAVGTHEGRLLCSEHWPERVVPPMEAKA